jgi:hypothetical protein
MELIDDEQMKVVRKKSAARLSIYYQAKAVAERCLARHPIQIGPVYNSASSNANRLLQSGDLIRISWVESYN